MHTIDQKTGRGLRGTRSDGARFVHDHRGRQI